MIHSFVMDHYNTSKENTLNNSTGYILFTCFGDHSHVLFWDNSSLISFLCTFAITLSLQVHCCTHTLAVFILQYYHNYTTCNKGPTVTWNETAICCLPQNHVQEVEQVLLRLTEMSSATSASLYHNDSKEAIKSVSIHPLRTSVFFCPIFTEVYRAQPKLLPSAGCGWYCGWHPGARQCSSRSLAVGCGRAEAESPAAAPLSDRQPWPPLHCVQRAASWSWTSKVMGRDFESV